MDIQDYLLYTSGIIGALIVIKEGIDKVFKPMITKMFSIEFQTKHGQEIDELNKKIKCQEMESKDFFKQLQADIKSDISTINTRLDSMDETREEQKELLLLTLQGVSASLSALKANGANGPVTNAIQQIDDYKNKKAVCM